MFAGACGSTEGDLSQLQLAGVDFETHLADLSDPEKLLQYVAWGDNGREMSANATQAGLWPIDETVATEADTIVLIRTDPTGTTPDSWEARSEVD